MMIASNQVGITRGRLQPLQLRSFISRGLPFHCGNRIQRASLRVAFRRDDEETEEQRNQNFMREVEDQLSRIADNVDDISLGSGSKQQDPMPQVPMSLPEALRKYGQSKRPRVTATYWGPPQWPVWSRLREIWLGRIAMTAFAVACAAEVATGRGLMAQLEMWPGVPHSAGPALVAAFALHGILGVLLPNAPTYSNGNLQDLLRRPVHYGGLLCHSSWGFSKKNELLHGRLALLGLAAALLLEGPSGGAGPLGQLAWWVGVQPGGWWCSGAAAGLLGWAVVATAVAGLRGSLGGRPVEGDEDVY